ncbi:alpha/beta fold hydrolase [Leptobacterium flavescens]|uniref:Alpha/beta fold hydrolase n=1 Tax=Leptobacterium flavescens TaxID=472055 RepID=A0A6P0UUN7_9FLAO|nr:bifunctional alpha/beta hydrolase/OsmC family protein [Leptobacterium flavescens]NER14126.1 alpha/beta fold hydrolase [Leptobacterium flavescens]
MSLTTVSFKNKQGHTLSGRLELPANQSPHNFAIFAHCFTCNKNLGAVRNISRALTGSGFGVLRFDFTGLGESEGDFSDTNFSGNVEDLIAASDFLSENHKSPSLIVGHSLGGAASIFAAAEIDSIQAVATIGAPSNPRHVKHLLHSSLEEIEQSGIAKVVLSGRDFTIKKQFIDDLESKSLPETVKAMRKPLLVMHSPQDDTVGIKNAEEIYIAAHHPKSFVSLDGADHLLMKKEDSVYAGDVIASWAKRYISFPKEEQLRSRHQVVASLDAEDGFTTKMKVGDHYLVADEPESVGGKNYGPTPYELVSAGLAACTAMTIKMYTSFKKWDLQHVEVHTSYDKKHAEDCENCESNAAKIDTFTREIKVVGDLNEDQRSRIINIANKCPVHKTLHNEVKVETKLIN